MKFRRSFTLILFASLLTVLPGLSGVPAPHAAQTLTITDQRRLLFFDTKRDSAMRRGLT